MKTSVGFAPVGILIGVALAILAIIMLANSNSVPGLIVGGVGVSAWSLYYLVQYIAVLVYSARGGASDASVTISPTYSGPAKIGLIAVDGDMPQWMHVVRAVAILCLVVFWVSALILVGMGWASKAS